jgi:nucleoside 2-deoxyribosyltransferase
VKYVYLAGPITGCDQGEANTWRDLVSVKLRKHNIRGISPLRCEPLVGDRYKIEYADPRFGTAKAIASKNFYDVQACDLLFAYMPAELNDRELSQGTLGELHWGFGLRKPTILVSDCEKIIRHPVNQAAASWILSTLDEGIDVVVGLLADYAREAA